MAPQRVEEEDVDNGFTETLDDKLEKVRHHQNSQLAHQHRVCIGFFCESRHKVLIMIISKR